MESSWLLQRWDSLISKIHADMPRKELTLLNLNDESIKVNEISS